MRPSVNPRFLDSSDCFQCRRCCRFDPDEIIDAPLFTDGQLVSIEDLVPQMPRFSRKGKLFQVILDKIPGSQKCICPLYDSNDARCVAYSLQIFDCKTWPFYVVKLQDGFAVALSNDCPVIWQKATLEELKIYAREELGPQMLEMVRGFPDLAAKIREDMVFLCHL